MTNPHNTTAATVIQDALDSHSEVWLPNGDWLISQPLLLNSGQRFYLSEQARLIRTFTGVTLRNRSHAVGAAATPPYDRNITVMGGEFTIDSDSHIGRNWEFNMVEGLKLIGSRFSGVSGSWNTYIQANDVLIESLEMDSGNQFGEDGIHVVGGQGIRIIGCSVKCGDDCIALGTGSTSRWDLQDVDVSGCYGLSRSARLVAVFIDTNGSDCVVKNISVRGVTGKAGRRGFSIQDETATGGLISRVTFADLAGDCSTNSTYGIYVGYADAVQLSRVRILQPSIAAGAVFNSNQVRVDACDLLSPRSTGQQCFYAKDSAGVHLGHSYLLESGQHGVIFNNVTDGSIQGNYIVNPSQYGILLAGTTSGIDVTGNRVNGGTHSFSEENSADYNRVHHNDFRGSSGGAIQQQVGTHSLVANNIGVD